VAAFAAAALVIGSPDPAARFTPWVVGAGETAVLVFTRTADFRHDSIPDATSLLIARSSSCSRPAMSSETQSRRPSSD